MSAGAGPPSPQQGQQDPLAAPQYKGPGLLSTLAAAIPIVGPGIYGKAAMNSQAVYTKALLDLATKRHREDQQIAADDSIMKQTEANGANEVLDPDTRLQWQQLHAKMALAKHGNPAKALDKDLTQNFQDLYGFTQGQLSSKQAAVPSQISNMPPPPASFGPTAGGIPLNGAQGPASAPSTPGLPGLLPQGAGAPKVPASPQGPAVAPQQPMEMTPPPPGLQDWSTSPNPLLRGMGFQTDLAMRQAQAAVARGESMVNAYKQIGGEQSGIPFSQFVETIQGKTITPAPLISAEEGKTVFGPTGIPKFSVGKTVTTPPGAETKSGVVEPPVPLSASGVPQMPPPPTGSVPTPGAPPTMGNVISAPPAQLNPDEGRFLSAAQQIAAKYKLPFDPTKNPRNPLAQIPTRYQAEVNALAAEQKMDPESRATMLALRESTIQNRQFQQRMEQNRRADQSYKFQVGEMDKVSKPVDDSLSRLSRLQDTLNQQNPQADALVAPELLSFTSGGQGSGLRMNEAEISRIVGGRSNWENLKAAANKWRLDPKEARSITPAQDKQIRDLVEAMSQKLKAKRSILDDAYSKLISSDDPEEHKRIGTSARRAVSAIDQGQGQAQAGMPRINTKAEYDALPSGTVYTDVQDGKQYRKK